MTLFPSHSNRNGRFDLKRRSDRALASFHGLYGNRGSEAREISDDEDCTLKTEQRAKDKQGNRRQKFEAIVENNG